jgi:hypothetical protein
VFENPGFVKWDNFEYEGVNYPIPVQSDFYADIQQAIPIGDPTPIAIGSAFDGEPWLPSLNDLAGLQELFDPTQEGGVKAILVTPGPNDGSTGAFRYPNEINIIKGWVNSKFDLNAETFIYSSTNNAQSNNQNTATGKILFMYDPSQATVVSDEVIIGGDRYKCPTQFAGWQLWVGYQDFLGGDQYTPYVEDNWPYQFADTISPAPVGTGLTLPGKRDDVPNACVKVDDSGSTSATDSATASASGTGSGITVPTTFSTITTTSSSDNSTIVTPTGTVTTSSEVSTTSSALVATGVCWDRST